VQHEKQKGWLRVRLADALRPCFEQPGVAYTSAPYCQVAKLESPLAYRLYWLLREKAAHGTRMLELAQLAWMLKMPLCSPNISLFCGRQLIAAQRQLAATDLPCTIELEYARQKSRLYAAHFHFTPTKSVRAAGLFPGTESNLDDTDWFGLEEVNTLLQGLLLLFSFIAGGAYVAALATGGAG
jgi:hypothetical protein